MKTKTETISFSIRVPEQIHGKLRIMSAFRNVSLNTVINEALEGAIRQWEEQYGALPEPPSGLQ